MKKLIYQSVAILLLLAVAVVMTACMSTAPDGEGSKDEAGQLRDPGELLPVGGTAPEFSVADDAGTMQRLADYRGKTAVVLIFYPGNETPGCTAQLCAARDSWKEYEAAGVQVFGVNPADAESHAAFRKNHSFPFPLLVDADGAVTRAYGARGPLGVVKRTVYAIARDGRIVFAERGMPSTKTILDALNSNAVP